MQQLQKAKDQRDQAKEVANDLREEIDKMRRDLKDTQQKLQVSEAEVAEGGARGRSSAQSARAEQAAAMKAEQMADELAMLKRQLQETQEENVSMKAAVEAGGKAGGAAGGKAGEPTMNEMKLELEKMKRQLTRAEEEKAAMKLHAAEEVAAAKKSAADASRQAAAAEQAAAAGGAGKRGGAGAAAQGDLSPSAITDPVQSHARIKDLEEQLRQRDAKIAKSEQKKETESKDLAAKTEEVQQLQVALEELRLRVVNLKDLLKKAGVETSAMKDAGLDDVIQGGPAGKSIGYDKYKFWKTWDRLYQDARDRIVRLQEQQQEAWNEKEKIFLQIYYSIMGEEYTKEKAEALKGDPYPASPHASPRTSPYNVFSRSFCSDAGPGARLSEMFFNVFVDVCLVCSKTLHSFYPQQWRRHQEAQGVFEAVVWKDVTKSGPRRLRRMEGRRGVGQGKSARGHDKHGGRRCFLCRTRRRHPGCHWKHAD